MGLGLILALASRGLPQPQSTIRHDMRVVVAPAQHALSVEDTITFPVPGEHPAPNNWTFVLHAGLAPQVLTPGGALVPVAPETLTPVSGATASLPQAAVPLERFTVTLPPGTRVVTLQYAGLLHHPWPTPNDALGAQAHPGSIAPNGVYLHAGTYWYPTFPAHLLTFTLEVQLPTAWQALSQGVQTYNQQAEGTVQVRWESPEPQEQIYLLGGAWTPYVQAAGATQAMVFLRAPDAALAQAYLDATQQYLKVYGALIAPYPYKKFAVIENLWESGYGMPSFTLLGPRVLRLPFILHSSYPHEILHSWWGNGVFVDSQQGNWCEGLTAYLADHLLQEQRGTAGLYRRATLQKYTDYVSTATDIALVHFQARHDPATEALGYGKAMMLFHMLRQQLGDEAFMAGLRQFYQTYVFRQARFDHLFAAFADVSGQPLDEMFTHWVRRPGAPELRLVEAKTHGSEQPQRLTLILEQVQPGPVYPLRIPLAMSLVGSETAYQTIATMVEKQLRLTVDLPALPRRLDVDPEFDLFRRLHRQELPPALSQAFGAAHTLFVLPAAAPSAVRQDYEHFVQLWQRREHGVYESRWDTDLDALPIDRAVWLLGWENRFRFQVQAALANSPVRFDANAVHIDATVLTRAEHTVVLTTRQAMSPYAPILWVATDNRMALAGLSRKLPHYGRYSYLGFTGDEPRNILHGEWPVLSSPLAFVFADTQAPGTAQRMATLASRKVLTPARRE